MDYKGLKLFTALQGKMSWLEQRQKLLSENIANANTAGYRPSDLKEVKFRDVLKNAASSTVIANASKPAQTHAGHMSAPNTVRGGVRYEVKSLDVQQDGNGVELEGEMTKLAENRMSHELATNLYGKHARMLKTALGRSS